MSGPLFITGAGGYLGQKLVELIDPDNFDDIILLSHQAPVTDNGAFCRHSGDLLDAATYEEAIPEGAMIIHLAALTGKGRRSDHFRVNLQGTHELLGAANRRKSTGVLFVSSVAAAFTDRPGYHYADAKLEAEKAVAESGLAHQIVRPTMIFGPGAPVLDGLAKMAKAPVVPVFGGGGVRCQPVHVDDLARWILFAMENLPFDGACRGVGGPSVLSMRELLQKIRVKTGKKPGGLMSFPLRPVRGVLRILEGPLHSLLPLTAGQLASFANDSTADALSEDEGASLLATTLDAMLDEAFHS